jgi:hypothetical protein
VHRHRCCATDSHSDRPTKRSATHTATRRHSNTATHAHCRTQQHAHSIQAHSAAATHTNTVNTQHARQHGRRKSGGGAALPTRPRPRAATSSADTPHTQQSQHCTAFAAGSYTTAVRHCDCDMHDHRARVALVRSTDYQRPLLPPTVQHACTRNTALPLQSGASARMHAAKRDAQTRAINRTQSHAPAALGFTEHTTIHIVAHRRHSRAQNSWQASRTSAISTCSTTPRLKTAFVMHLKQLATRRTSVPSDFRCCQG